MNTKVMNRNAKRLTISAALAISSLMTVTVNAATQPGEAPSVEVRYGDLNLASQKGAHLLYRRIVVASEKVCVGANSRDPRVIARARSCQADAIARAVRDVNNPQLAAAHSAMVSRG